MLRGEAHKSYFSSTYMPGRPDFPSPTLYFCCPTYRQPREGRVPANIEFETTYKTLCNSISHAPHKFSHVKCSRDDLSKTMATYMAFNLSHHPKQSGDY